MKCTKLFIGAALAAFLLTGCAVMQQNPYTACEGKPLCTAYGTYAMVGFSTAYALNHDQITVEQAKDVKSKLNQIHNALDAIRLTIMNGRADKSTYNKLAETRQALHELAKTLPEAPK